jgi:hypothetical protein
MLILYLLLFHGNSGFCERASKLRYTYIDCLVLDINISDISNVGSFFWLDFKQLWPTSSLFFPLIWKDRTQGWLMRSIQHVIPRPSYRGEGVGMSDHGVLGKTALDKVFMNKNRVKWTRSLTQHPTPPIAQSTYK